MGYQAKKAAHQPESWFRAVTRCATRIRKQFSVPDQATEDRMVRVFRAALRPRQKAGRKPDPATVRAAEMWIDGMEAYAGGYKRLRRYQRWLWQKIYREIFREFERLDKLTRQYRTSALRRNVKAYLRRQGCKWSKGIRVSPAMSARKRVVFPPTRPAAQ
jgi:hypothetical protein